MRTSKECRSVGSWFSSCWPGWRESCCFLCWFTAVELLLTHVPVLLHFTYAIPLSSKAVGFVSSALWHSQVTEFLNTKFGIYEVKRKPKESIPMFFCRPSNFCPFQSHLIFDFYITVQYFSFHLRKKVWHFIFS